MWYGGGMMVKIYWFFRIAAYAACIGGVAWFFTHQTDANGGQEGLYAVYAGFLAFFVSYALRFFLRFGGKTRSVPPRRDEDGGQE